MASPALLSPQIDDNDSDYGSDFSAGEEEIVSRLLSGTNPGVLEEDNPITTEIEYHDTQQTLRLPRIYAIGNREERSPLFQAARAAEEVAEQLSRVVAKGERYPDCEFLFEGIKW